MRPIQNETEALSLKDVSIVLKGLLEEIRLQAHLGGMDLKDDLARRHHELDVRLDHVRQRINAVTTPK